MTIAAALSPILAAFGLGLGLAGAPGAVQAVLVTESVRGGIARGARALAGAHVTFALLLVGLALGVSLARPSRPLVRVLEVAGGVFLIGLALDAVRSGQTVHGPAAGRPWLPAMARGALAILLNPGGWVFLAVVASPLLAGAAAQAGAGGGLAAALALVAGAALGDAAVVVVAATGLRRVGERRRTRVLRTLALLLAGLGVALAVRGVVG